jgi:predicted kinase/GNAT superfamily N-acetyltransferase
MDLIVRRAEIADVPVLRALRIEALTAAPEAFGSTLEREVNRTEEDWLRWLSPGVTFLLDADGKPGGMVAGVQEVEDVSTVDLMAMWVHPEARGTGAAALLIAAVRKWAGSVGATQVRLKVVEENLRARRCYERYGLRATGRFFVREKDGATELEMECESVIAGGRLILVCGLPGSGKTTHAIRLEGELRALRLCPDDWMSARGTDLYDAAARARIEALQWKLAQRVLALGRTVIIEWGTWGRSERDKLREGARGLGAEVELHYHAAPVEVLFERIQRRGMENPPIGRADLENWIASFQEPTAEEAELFDRFESYDLGLTSR